MAGFFCFSVEAGRPLPAALITQEVMKENAQDFWGKLQQTLNNYWTGFIHLLPRLALAIVLMLVVLFLARHISKLLRKHLSDKAHDPLFTGLVAQLAKAVLIICGIILVMQVLGLSGIAAGLLAGAGISAFIIGFAFKDIAENFLAGIILAFNRPFALNESIKIQEYIGHVKALNFRTTHLKTFDEKDVFLPNSMVLQEVVTNLTRDGMIRIDFVVGIAYEDDIASAIKFMIQAMKQTEGVNTSKEPFAVVENLNVNTVDIRAYFWTQTDDYRKGVLETKGKVMKEVKEILSDKGFTLPANIQELKLYEKSKSIPIEMVQPSSPES